jgi:hypothetical protein
MNAQIFQNLEPPQNSIHKMGEQKQVPSKYPQVLSATVQNMLEFIKLSAMWPE